MAVKALSPVDGGKEVNDSDSVRHPLITIGR
jgi:hypothetical protein